MTMDNDGAISTMNVTYNRLGIQPLISLLHLSFGLKFVTEQNMTSNCLAMLGYALEQQAFFF
jgi:hypothetical protein